jgi:hypothetical protein
MDDDRRELGLRQNLGRLRDPKVGCRRPPFSESEWPSSSIRIQILAPPRLSDPGDLIPGDPCVDAPVRDDETVRVCVDVLQANEPSCGFEQEYREPGDQESPHRLELVRHVDEKRDGQQERPTGR